MSKYYYAYEDINMYSPVFVFYDEASNKNMIYVSQDLNAIDNGSPNVIGVVTVNLKKGDKITESENKLITNGITRIKYIGAMPKIATNVYVVKTWNDEEYKGYVAPLEKGIVPVNFDSSFILKVGTVYPIDNQPSKNDILPDDLVTKRVIHVSLSINNTSFDLYNIYTLDLLPNTNINGRNFSYYDIGQILKKGLENPLCIDKFNTLINAYKNQVPLSELCKAIFDYCNTLYLNLEDGNVPEDYENRLMVCVTSGQVVFDSVNPLNLYDTNTEMCTMIPLVANPFNVTHFELFKSLIRSHLYSYVDTTTDNGSDFVGSTYTLLSSGMYEMAQACVNGVGIGSRYCKITDTYNYNVAWYLGITESYNVNDAEALIVRLGWKLKN